MERLGDGPALIVMDGSQVPCSGGCGTRVDRVVLLGRDVPVMCVACTERDDAEDRASAHAQERERLFSRSGRTPRMARWSLDTYPTDASGKKARKPAAMWLATFLDETRTEPCPNLLLVGGVGTGKTGLAWSLVRNVIEEQLIEARLVNWRVLLTDMADAMRRGGRVQEALGLHRLPLLAIDDLGSERLTDWRREELANLIERRYQRELPTIVTMNFALPELAARLDSVDPSSGERLASRLLDGAIVVRFTGPDRRTGALRSIPA